MTHQQKINAANALLSRFQNEWQNGRTALDAYNRAQLKLIQTLEQQIADIANLSYIDFSKIATDNVDSKEKR